MKFIVVYIKIYLVIQGLMEVKFHATLTLGMEGDVCLTSSADKVVSLLIGQDVGWAPDLVWILWISLPLPEAKP